MANAAPPPPPPASPAPPPMAAAAASQDQASMAVEVNAARLGLVADRLSLHFQGAITLGSPVLLQLCYALARGMDYALSSNDKPQMADRIPALLKMVYQHKNNSLHSALMVLMISAKNACKNGWFQPAEIGDILAMETEHSSSFCVSMSSIPEAGNAYDVISKIMPRFYPQLKFGRLIVSFEAKPGYDILMADFFIQRQLPPDERIRLFAVQTENLELSSCITSPPHASFLINGKGVEKRTNVSMDVGPQFPTDITKMLKYGTNIIQAVGYFNGNYIIAIAFISHFTCFDTPVLQDYVRPVVADFASDSEIIEGASRVSLTCPISFKRLKTPVKGHLCKHHQCFDYNNYMEMNSRRPLWRCPFCNTYTSCLDLRIDRNMVKILQEVGDGVLDVFISSDGSWKVVGEHNGSSNQQPDGKQNAAHTSPDVIDVMEEHDSNVPVACTGQEEPLLGIPDKLGEVDDNDKEDRKPIIDFVISDVVSGRPLVSRSVVTQTPYQVAEIENRSPINFSSAPGSGGLLSTASGMNSRSVGTLGSIIPDSVLNPVITDVVSPAVDHCRTAPFANSESFSFQPVSQVSQHMEHMQLQQSRRGDSLISNEIGRPLIPRNTMRTPAAVQALPVTSETPSSSKRILTDLLSGPSVTPTGSSSPYQALQSAGTRNGNVEVEQSRAFDIPSSSLQLQSTLLNWDRQERQNTPNLPAQEVVGLSASTVPSMGVLPERLRGADAYNASLQPTPKRHAAICYPASQPASIPLSTHVPSAHVPQALQAGTDPAVGNLDGHLSTPLSSQHGQAVRMLAGGTSMHSSSVRAQSSFPASADRSGMPRFARPDGLPEVPSEQSWRPTRRMRGSLTGEAFSAALNQYLIPPTLPGHGRPPISSVDTIPPRQQH